MMDSPRKKSYNKFKAEWNYSFLSKKSGLYARCLLCKKRVISKKCNIKRHYETFHEVRYKDIQGQDRMELVNALIRTAGVQGEKSSSIDLETVLSETSESHQDDCDPLLIQDESLPSEQGPLSSMDITSIPVVKTPPLQSYEIPKGINFSPSVRNSQLNDEDESTLDAPETYEYQLQDLKNDFEGKAINGALQKLDEVCDKFNQLAHCEDEYDHFGSYVASLLRRFPFRKAFVLQRNIIDLILDSQIEPRQPGQKNEESTTHISKSETSRKSEHSKLHHSAYTSYAAEGETPFSVHESSPSMNATPLATALPPQRNVRPMQSHEVPEDTSFSQSMPGNQSNGRGENRTFVGPTNSHQRHSNHLRNYDFITHNSSVDDSLRKLDDVCEKFNTLANKDDGLITFNHFGKYVASLLRQHPLSRALAIEKKVIDFILKSHLETLLQVPVPESI